MKKITPFIALFCLFTHIKTAFCQNPIPHLLKKGNTTQLIVEGKPFIILGGELGNSSVMTPQYMQPIWGKLKTMNLNTVLIPVYWELIEAQEGKFDNYKWTIKRHLNGDQTHQGRHVNIPVGQFGTQRVELYLYR
jgi:Domain of unknown function (DUF5597)/Glycosyl hydrolases family 35